MPRSFTVLAGVLLLAVGIAIVAGGGLPRAGSVAPIVLPSPTATATPASTGSTIVSPTAAPTIGPIPDGYRIELPRLGIDLPIAEGDVERDVVIQKTPENFAFHFPGTAIPGTVGNSYIYAHARRGMFLSLWNARVGDQVTVVTPAGIELKFVVTEVHPRVPPADTSWLQPSADERLTLQTSTGPNRDDPRFVVIAAPD
jgi:LPXTG-site transpeptidase (sortase) family protein